MQYVTLNTGAQMPQLGFGVYQIPEKETERIVSQAIKTGYRHIDTAQYYRNEVGVGQAIKASSSATRSMPAGSDPHRLHRLFWAIAQGMLALGLLTVGGLNVAKIFGNFSGALMALPVIVLTLAWLKIIREDGKGLLMQVKKD